MEFLGIEAGKTFTADQLEGVFFSFTGKVLQAFLTFSLYNFFVEAKSPPPDTKLKEEDGPLARHFLALTGGLSAKYTSYAGLSLLLDRMLSLFLGCACFSQVRETTTGWGG